MRNLLLVLVSVAVAAGAAELYLRAQHANERRRIRAAFDATDLCTAPARHRRLIYTYVPGACGTNSQGYRDAEHAFTKPAGTFRIVLIGDSVAEGRGVAADSSFGKVLERALNEKTKGRHYEIILLARAGYSTSQQIVLLESEAFRYAPDLILWSYCLNDPAHPVHHNANGELGRYYYRPRSYLAGLVSARAFRAKQKWRGRGCPHEFHEFVHCAFRPEVERDIRRIAALAHSRGTPVAFVVHPLFERARRFDAYSMRDVHARLRDTAEAAGLTFFDVLDAFVSYDPDSLKIHDETWFDPWHMNTEGHRVTAAFLFERLDARGLLAAR